MMIHEVLTPNLLYEIGYFVLKKTGNKSMNK